MIVNILDLFNCVFNVLKKYYISKLIELFYFYECGLCWWNYKLIFFWNVNVYVKEYVNIIFYYLDK